MADLATLQVQLELQSAQFAQGMDGVQRQLDALNKKVSSTQAVFQKFGTALVTAVASAGVVQGFKRIIDGMDDMSKAAQKLGTSVESLSALAFAADLSGVAFDTLSSGLRKLSQNMADIETSTDAAGKALRALGVTAGDNVDTALAKIADGFAAVPDSARKTALAMELFGKSGAELIPLLNEGAEGIEELKARAAELGIVLDGSTTKQAERFNDAMSEIFASTQGVLTQITRGFLPAFEQIAVSFAKSAKAGKEWEAIGTAIGATLKTLVSAGYIVATVFQLVGTNIAVSIAGIQALMSGNIAGAIEIVKSGYADMGRIISETTDRIATLWVDIEPPSTVKKSFDETSEGAKRMGKAFDALGKDGTKAAKAVKQVKEELDPLSKAIDDLVKLAAERAQAENIVTVLSSEGTIKALQTAGVAMDDITAAIQRYRDVADPAGVKAREQAKALKELGDSIRSSVDPVFVLSERIKELNSALEKGAIDLSTYDKALEKAYEDFNKGTKEAKDATLSWQVALGGVIKDGIGALTDALFENGKSFSEWATDVVKSIAKVLVQMALLKIAKQTLGSTFGFSEGAAFNSSGVQAFAQGGAFHNSVLNGPRMFATGGAFSSLAVAGEAGPEAIIPLRRDSSGDLGVGGAPVNVVVNNLAPDTQVEVAENQQPDGTREISLTIRREVRAALGDGSLDSTLRGNYGITRRAVV